MLKEKNQAFKSLLEKFNYKFEFKNQFNSKKINSFLSSESIPYHKKGIQFSINENSFS